MQKPKMARRLPPRPEAPAPHGANRMPESSSINALIRDVTAAEGPLCDPNATRKKAMDLLARREHTRAELLEKLVRAGFDENVALDVIEALRDEGLQSDRRFVDSFIQSRVRQGKGPLRIRAELAKKGVRDPLIHEALSDADADWRALAAEVRRKKFGDAVPGEFADKARQMRFLQYRGFDSEHIQGALAAD